MNVKKTIEKTGIWKNIACAILTYVFPLREKCKTDKQLNKCTCIKHALDNLTIK